MDVITKTVELRSGLRLPYAEHGAPDGDPVIFLHGVTDSWRSFENVLPLLPKSLRALAVTQRGHGDASRPEGGYTFAGMAEDLAAFMDALHLDSAVLVGHSMGSTVARRFAVDHPWRVDGLVLVGSFSKLRGNRVVREFFDTTIANLSDPIDSLVARDFQVGTLARPIADAQLELFVQESLKVPARIWKAAFTDFLEDDFVEDLGAIRAPTLLVWGDQDAFCSRADQDELLSAIPGARLAAIEGAGHALHWEDPEGFAQRVARFVADIEQRPRWRPTGLEASLGL